MISCTSKTEIPLKNHVSKLSEFLSTYEWMTEAYVSDFFFKEHWAKLPDLWQRNLPNLSTEELSGLVDRGKWKTRQVLPLSLLSFASCTKALSLDRSCEKDFKVAFNRIFKVTDSSCSSDCKQEVDVNGEENSVTHGTQDSILKLQDCDGKLHAFFRKHVKPKKQHEILNLGEVIKLLCEHTGCSSVVDVGAGLGHLSRLLSFGHGLKVTSVEAAGTHAPKANKYDREIDRELKKKKKKVDSKEDEESYFPCHVTSMIYPDTSVQDFLTIVNSQRQADSGLSEEGTTTPVHCQKNVNANENHWHLHSFSTESITEATTNQITKEKSQNTIMDRSLGTGTNYQSCIQNQGSRDVVHQENCDKSNKDIDRNEECLKRHCNLVDCDLNTKMPKFQGNQNSGQISRDSQNSSSSRCSMLSSHDTNLGEHSSICSELSSESNQKTSDDSKMECLVSSHSVQSFNHKQNSGNQCIGSQTGPHIQENYSEKDAVCDENQSIDEQTGSENGCNTNQQDMCNQSGASKSSESKFEKDNNFILTGLHACGDLTPTFLRFFVNCGIAQGLASVGCCYMKITDTSEDGKSIGYPMSRAVKSLPHHRLTYNARELACHFADTYSQRLKDCPAHLKIHSYRAALEWLANQLCADFKRTAVQIPSKKSDKMDFESYARLGLKKLGIDEDKLTEDLLTTATAMTVRWKDVVAFYTLRLSLAPVVETLVLLDRMLFLLENGFDSAVMPIFDPNLSPRNFVLLSWKHK